MSFSKRFRGKVINNKSLPNDVFIISYYVIWGCYTHNRTPISSTTSPPHQSSSSPKTRQNLIYYTDAVYLADGVTGATASGQD